MKEERNNGKGIFYGVIGIATLIVAIIGATFAYFTASQSNYNKITGNAAVVSFDLTVNKVTQIDETKGGIVPMTDSMVKAAVTADTPCQDNNGNAVCQIYSITVNNTGTASVYLDGYVNLIGGYDESTGVEAWASDLTDTDMRWAQVFATTSGETTTYDVTGAYNIAYDADNTNYISTSTLNLNFGDSGSATAVTSETSYTSLNETQSLSTYTFGDNTYSYINNNYMRTSGHTFTEDLTQTQTFDREDDASSALTYSQYLEPTGKTGNSITYYIVVWLTETGLNQTLDTTEAVNFFGGKVNFISSTGGEVSATFNGYTRTARTD